MIERIKNYFNSNKMDTINKHCAKIVAILFIIASLITGDINTFGIGVILAYLSDIYEILSEFEPVDDIGTMEKKCD